jgi:hypothetical protein
MLAAPLVGVVAFTVLYAYLIALRLRVGRLEERAASEALSARTFGLTPPAGQATAAGQATVLPNLDGQARPVGAHGGSASDA